MSLQVVYDLACEMSHAGWYAEIDDDGVYSGTNPRILKALEDVRSFFRLKGTP